MEYSFCVIHTFVNFTILKLPIENCRQYCGFKKFESFSVDLFYTIGKISVLFRASFVLRLKVLQVKVIVAQISETKLSVNVLHVLCLGVLCGI